MTEPKTINELIENVREKMKNLDYTNSSMASYEKVWKSFKMYAQKKGINLYTTEVGLAFLEKKCKFISRYPIKYTMDEQVRAINRLDEYFKYNMISTKRPNSKKYTFPAAFRELVQSYIDFRRVEGLSESRIKAINNYMERFTNFLDDVGLKNISELDISHIHRFIQFSNNYTVSISILFDY